MDPGVDLPGEMTDGIAARPVPGDNPFQAPTSIEASTSTEAPRSKHWHPIVAAMGFWTLLAIPQLNSYQFVPFLSILCGCALGGLVFRKWGFLGYVLSGALVTPVLLYSLVLAYACLFNVWDEPPRVDRLPALLLLCGFAGAIFGGSVVVANLFLKWFLRKR